MDVMLSNFTFCQFIAFITPSLFKISTHAFYSIGKYLLVETSHNLRYYDFSAIIQDEKRQKNTALYNS